MRIDFDDVAYGFLYGGCLVVLAYVILAFALAKPVIDDCEKKGGIVVKCNHEVVCIDKNAPIKERK